MASVNLEAWRKYFKGKGNVDVPVKGTAKLKTTAKGGSDVTIPQGTVITLLEQKTDADYLSYSENPTGRNPKAWLPVKHKGKTYLCDINLLAKIKESGKVDLGLQTGNLLAGATIKKLDVFGQTDVECAVFPRASIIADLCVKNLKNNTMLAKMVDFRKSLLNYFEDITDPSTIKWFGSVDTKELAEFKYLGEICVGLCLMKGKKNSPYMTGDPVFSGASVKNMIYPMSQSFTGVDSIVELRDGTMIPISSKAGKGAAASFFANVFTKVLENPTKYAPTGSVLAHLVSASKGAGVDANGLKTKAKKVVYEFGVRKILGVDKRQLSDANTVYEEFVAKDGVNNYSPSVRAVYSLLEQKMETLEDQTSLRNLDSSTTVFFSKTIADMLNNDKKSMNVINTVLGTKGYYQVNLDMKQLKDGKVRFSVINAGGSDVKIIGTKSSYSDITAKQGTVNYILE